MKNGSQLCATVVPICNSTSDRQLDFHYTYICTAVVWYSTPFLWKPIHHDVALTPHTPPGPTLCFKFESETDENVFICRDRGLTCFG